MVMAARFSEGNVYLLHALPISFSVQVHAIRGLFLRFRRRHGEQRRRIKRNDRVRWRCPAPRCASSLWRRCFAFAMSSAEASLLLPIVAA